MIKKWIFSLGVFLAVFTIGQLEAQMVHQKVISENWRVENLAAFDELILSWNAKRPIHGKYLFYVSVKIDTWSPWLLYATWGSEGQSSFKTTSENFPTRIFQDTLEVLKGKKATGFQVKIVTEGSCALEGISGFHVYTNGDQKKDPIVIGSLQHPVHLRVQGLSQMKLNHDRYRDLCSPTSTFAALRYLLKNVEMDPVFFAESSLDKGFDIFGNWVFNVAQASTVLGPDWDCWVERLSGFDSIYEKLQQTVPVVVSIRGPLVGSAQPYAKGHLLVVIGYDPDKKRVICMDPAFASDDQTEVSYDLLDFMKAWGRRGRVAYIFNKSQKMQ